MSGPQTVKEDRPDRVSHHADRIVGLANLSQRRSHANQGGCHVQFQHAVDELGHGQQLDAIAPQFPGVTQVGRVQRIDALPRDVTPVHPSAKRQVGKNRQFLSGVGPIDVHGRIRFRIPESLGR